MRAMNAASQDEDDDVVPVRKKKRATASRARPKIMRTKRKADPDGFLSRWYASMRQALRWTFFWGSGLTVFFGVVVIAGLFSGGQVQHALADAKLAGDALMVRAGLTVDQIILDGRKEAKPGEIGRMLGIKRGDLMLYVDIEEARARLESLPWLDSVEVRRAWPNRIYVIVKERKPVARFQLNGVASVIDDKGKIISGERPENHMNLPLVVGKGADVAIGSFLSLAASQPKFKWNIKSAVRVGERRWNLQLANGVEVRLPEEGAEAALAELVRRDRTEVILDRDIQAVDTRFEDRYILQKPEGSPTMLPIKSSGGRDT